MSDVKSRHILTLLEILLQGGRFNYVELTTEEVAKKINKSQQAASKHLIELERDELIERHKKGRKFCIKITEKGFLEVQNLYTILKNTLESSKKMEFEGIVVSGMGEGAYYMSLEGYRKQFKEKLGYIPFPGTLNIKLTEKIFILTKKELIKYPSTFIEGFNDNIRTYGWVRCYHCIISKINNDLKFQEKNDATIKPIDGEIVILERTHYDETMLELISPIPLKEKLGLKIGEKIKLKLSL
ncbi:MAG: riboflavin kinase [Nitrososphaeraceae archaeon]|nr:riboflavin kinase [Nitrososphaeraceae archaeon]